MIAEPLQQPPRLIGDFRLLDGNPRRGDVESVKRSLKRFGQRKPIVVREDGTVEAGNTTLKAALELGWPEIAVVAFGDDDVTAKAFALADNRTSELGAFDLAALAAMAADVHAADPELLEAASYTEADLNALLAGQRVPEKHTDPDAIPEPPSRPVTVEGDVWLLGPHRLMCGDSASSSDVSQLMDGKRAMLMATDPPYLVGYQGGNHPQSPTNSPATREKRWSDYKEHGVSSELYTDFMRVAFDVALVERAPVYQWHAGLRVGALLEAWENNGLLVHQVIVWVKSRPVLTRNHFMWQHEPALYGWRKGMQPANDRRPPSNATTFWQVDKAGAESDTHPTEKPVELSARPIGWHTRPGEICYEPFSGSGSQIMAAHALNRSCYAMELAPAFADVACRRYQEHTGTKPVLAATGQPHDFTA